MLSTYAKSSARLKLSINDLEFDFSLSRLLSDYVADSYVWFISVWN